MVLTVLGVASLSSATSEPNRIAAIRSNGGFLVHENWAIIPLSQSEGIGFDDLQYSARLGRVLVPAGRLGTLALIDPRTFARADLRGMTQPSAHYTGGHDEGVTFADEGNGYIYATDRTSKRLWVFNAHTLELLANAPLAASPDYVRFVEAQQQIWVTEPDREQIEVFTAATEGNPQPEPNGVIAIAGGPESLLIDAKRRLAFTHLWRGLTVSISTEGRSIRGRWHNGCAGSRGIAEDVPGGFLFVGCTEGQVTSLDVDHDGHLLSKVPTSTGVDVIAYNSRLRHVYAPGSARGQLSVVSVSGHGNLREIGRLTAQSGAHCVTTDNERALIVCDPDHGRLLVTQDRF